MPARKGSIRLWIAASAMVALVAAAIAFLWPRGGDLAGIEQRRLGSLRTEMAAAGFRLGDPVFIRVFKESSELELWVKSGQRHALYKTFPICKWSGALGPKLREGDGQSPEGFYSVARGQMNPNSQYHLSFDLGFPNAYDRAQGRTGSFLMIHGSCVSIGCYAMTDRGIEEIWLIADAALSDGQPAFDVQVFPFRLTAENLARHASSPWAPFWQALRVGYDRFETTHVPPSVSVANGAYAIN